MPPRAHKNPLGLRSAYTKLDIVMYRQSYSEG
jgi:hypothetical protein